MHFKVESFAVANFPRYEMLYGSLPFFHQGILIWPSRLENSVSGAARGLVEALLSKASTRPRPDEIVDYSFLTRGPYLEKMCSSFRATAPGSPTHGLDYDAVLYRRYCQRAGVGKDDDGQYWPCVGSEECVNSIRDLKEGPWSLGLEWDV
jgi:hypothetical protein